MAGSSSPPGSHLVWRNREALGTYLCSLNLLPAAGGTSSTASWSMWSGPQVIVATRMRPTEGDAPWEVADAALPGRVRREGLKSLQKYASGVGALRDERLTSAA